MTYTTFTAEDIATYNELVEADKAATRAGRPSDAELDMIVMEKRIERDFGLETLAEFIAVCNQGILSPFGAPSEL